MNGEPICAALVSSASGAASGLASTGATPIPLVIVGALVLVAGLLAVLGGHRHGRGVVLAVAGLAVTGLFLAGAPAVSAVAAEQTTESCALIRVDDIDRAHADNLLPGQLPVPVLAYSVTNVTAFPIAVTVTTAVTSDVAGVSGSVTVILSDPAGTVTASLADAPATTALRLDAGQSARYQYQVAVPPDVGNIAQDSSMEFDSIVAAAQL